MSERLVLLAIVIAAVSGIPGLFLSRRSPAGQWAAAALLAMAAVSGLCGVGVYWSTGDSQPIIRSWAIPGGEFHVAMDGLSALFLVPIFVVSMLGSTYGLGYWKQSVDPVELFCSNEALAQPSKNGCSRPSTFSTRAIQT